MDAAKSLIFPERAVAVAIMGALKARHPGATWPVKQAPSGFQIVKTGESKTASFVKAVAAYDALAKALGLKPVEMSPEMKAEMAKPLASPEFKTLAAAMVSVIKKHKNSALDQPCLVTLNYVKMIPEYIVAKNGGHGVWIEKTSTMGWQLEEAAGEEVMVAIKAPLWHAQKRRLAYNQI